MDHTILSKLQAYDIQGSTNQWFCSYLNRIFKLCVTTCSPSSLGIVNMTLRDSVIIRVFMENISIVRNIVQNKGKINKIDLPFLSASITSVSWRLEAF